MAGPCDPTVQTWPQATRRKAAAHLPRPSAPSPALGSHVPLSRPSPSFSLSLPVRVRVALDGLAGRMESGEDVSGTIESLCVVSGAARVGPCSSCC